MKHDAPKKTATASTPVVYASDVQLAQRYAVSRGTIWRWTHEGKLPKPYRFGGTTRWNLAEVIEMFETDAKSDGNRQLGSKRKHRTLK